MSKCNNCYHNKVCIDGTNYKTAESCKHYVPAADVQEVRHGRWVAKIMRKENYNYGVPYEISRCSECLYMLKNNGFVGRYNYCPNCGARMDGKDGEEE